MGRHPAALGLLDHRPARAGPAARPPGDRARRSPGFDDTFAPRPRRRRAPAHPGLPVARSGTPALAAVALADAGAAPGRPGPARRVRLAAVEGGHRVSATGATCPRRGRPGGWSFEFENEWYPDTDDTAEVLIALRRAGHPPSHPAIRRGVEWLLAMQSAERRLGRVRRRQRPPRHDPAPALRLRRGHRPAHRGRHRPRRRGAGRVRRAAPATRRCGAASPTSGAPSATTARGGAAGA